MTNPPIENAPVGADAQERAKIRTRTRIINLPSRPRKSRDGILFYRASRPPGEVVRCLTEALRREIRISDELGTPVSKDALCDICDWGDGEYLPL